MTTFEHKELKGITIKNMALTIFSTASIVVAVMTTYFQLKGDIKDVRVQNEAQTKINDIRLRVLEGQVALLQKQVEDIKNEQSTRPDRQSTM
jgi:hypothetical protein